MEEINFYNIITICLFLYVGYMVNCGLLAETNRKSCDRNKGNCKTCNCWSCPRFQYLTKEGELREFKEENKINFNVIKNKLKELFNKKDKRH